MRTAFESEGAIRSVDLLGAFATLWRQRASGIVTFTARGREVQFDVSEGDIVAAASSDDSFDTAEILRRAEKLSEEALADGRIPPGTDRARYLRDLGLLSDRDWRWGEKLRLVEILSDLVAWIDGTYRYDPAATPEPSDFTIGIHRVILELCLRSTDRAFIHHSLGAPDAALERASDFDEKFASLGLTPDALVVAAAIDGRASAADISRRTPPDPFSVEKLLAALVTLGLAHPEYALEPSLEAGAWEPEREPAPAVTEPEPEPPPTAEPEIPPEPEPAVLVEPPARPVAPEVSAAAPEPEDDLELLEMPSGEPPAKAAPGVDLWPGAPAEPLDQPLDVVPAPDFGASTRRRLSPIWLPLLLAAAVGALLLVRTRRPPQAATTAVPASPSAPARVTQAPAALPPPPAVAPPTPRPAATAPPAVVASPRPTLVERPAPERPATPRTREEWVSLAERDRQQLASDSRTRFSIQLELVCELPSLDEAWVYDRRGQMWLLAASHQGRSCFRVFWGRYRTLDEARAGKDSVPAFFFTPTNRPVVVSTSGALLR